MSGLSNLLGYEPLIMRVDGVVIYGLHAYGSMFDMRISPDKKPYATQAQRAYWFKKSGHSKSVFSELIERFREWSGASLVVAIPSSSVSGLSTLQDMYGVTIRRIADSEPRKYHHNRPVNDTGRVVLDVDVKDQKVVLVDDIVTTGASILFFRKMLLDAGASEVFALGVGMSFARSESAPASDDVELIVGSLRNSLETELVGSLESHLIMASDSLMKSLSPSRQIVVMGSHLDKLENVASEMKVSPDYLLKQIIDEL